MPNEVTAVEKTEEVNLAARRVSKSSLRLITLMSFAAMLNIALFCLWKNHSLPAFFQEETESFSLVEAGWPLPSMVPKVLNIGKEPVLSSQLPDINQELINQPSRIPNWLTAAVKQKVQPSPKRIMAITLDEEEHDDSLVVRDRVVVIPKDLPTINHSHGKSLAKSSLKPLPNKGFTIQLLAGHNQEEIKRFIKRHKIEKIAKIRLIKRDGLNWYVLTMGEFNRREQGREAMKNLPTALAQLNPWLRPLA